MLRFDRKQQNSVKQLSFNKKKKKCFAEFHVGDFALDDAPQSGKISHWMMLHGRVDQLKLIVIKLRH